jgi:hypothetical protein
MILKYQLFLAQKEEQLMTTDIRYSVRELLPKAFSILDEPKGLLWHESYLLNEVGLYRRAIASIISIQEDSFSAIDTIEAGYIFSRAMKLN